MAAEAEAAREARAKVIAADGEQKAASALRDAAEVISESSAALQLRYLQVKYHLDLSICFYKKIVYRKNLFYVTYFVTREFTKISP